MIKFNNNFTDWHVRLLPISQEGIRTLPMLYRADVDFALSKVPVLWDFISHLPVNPFLFKYRSLDVKVAMLKKGWYPCIPGWHCDDFYRPTGTQPDILNLASHNSRHFMALYGDASLTEFLDFPLMFPDPPSTGTVYGFYNRLINNLDRDVSSGYPVKALSERLYEFDSMTFHRGMPATKGGWRAFVRLTLGSERPPKNEIRSQVNVYVPHNELEAGW
jgi:hypothetical protein